MTPPPLEAVGEAPSSSFLGRLEAVAARRHHDHHPFQALLHAGRLDRGDLRLWVVNRHHHQQLLALRDALITAKAEDPAFRGAWVARLARELPLEGAALGAADGAARPAAELWPRLGVALGLAGLESGVEPLPEVRAAGDEYLEALRAADLLTALGFALADHFSARQPERHATAWRQHYPALAGVALAGQERLEPRSSSAPGSAELALAYLLAQARTPLEQQRCVAAFEQECSLLWRLLDAVYLARRRGRVPRLEHRASLIKLSVLASAEPGAPGAAPGVVLVPERALSLNRTGYDLLARCDGQLTLEQIIQQLSHHHGAARATVERDVATFVAELERRRVLAFEGGAV